MDIPANRHQRTKLLSRHQHFTNASVSLTMLNFVPLNPVLKRNKCLNVVGLLRGFTWIASPYPKTYSASRKMEAMESKSPVHMTLAIPKNEE